MWRFESTDIEPLLPEFYSVKFSTIELVWWDETKTPASLSSLLALASVPKPHNPQETTLLRSHWVPTSLILMGTSASIVQNKWQLGTRFSPVRRCSLTAIKYQWNIIRKIFLPALRRMATDIRSAMSLKALAEFTDSEMMSPLRKNHHMEQDLFTIRSNIRRWWNAFTLPDKTVSN